jgi:hypothetical protein
MKPKVLPLIESCIETGVRLGYNRAHKHVENPHVESIVEHITTEIRHASNGLVMLLLYITTITIFIQVHI